MTIMLALVAGLIFGIWHFGSLRWLCHRLINGRRHHWWRLIALQLFRVMTLILICALTVQHSSGPARALTLLLFALGILATRTVFIYLFFSNALERQPTGPENQ